uniref:Protein kinase domain-containing protein n=1 Tax=Steinernema glaseri TaxID=37863 RepID=A0A1I7ZXA1_9BILA
MWSGRSPTSVIPRFPDGSSIKFNGKELRIDKLLAMGNRMRVYQEILGSYRAANYECETHRELTGHPHVIKFISCGSYGKDGGRWLILMEQAPHGDLRDVIRKYGPVKREIAWRFFDQIVAALGHMHRQERVHCGVHPRNVFAFSTDLCKLGDFGNGHEVMMYCALSKISREETRDLRGAADTLLFLLLGYMPNQNKDFWEAFQEMDGQEEAQRVLQEFKLAEVMTVKEVLYLRKFYSDIYTSRPIPKAYGTLRTAMNAEFSRVDN